MLHDGTESYVIKVAVTNPLVLHKGVEWSVLFPRTCADNQWGDRGGTPLSQQRGDVELWHGPVYVVVQVVVHPWQVALTCKWTPTLQVCVLFILCTNKIHTDKGQWLFISHTGCDTGIRRYTLSWTPTPTKFCSRNVAQPISYLHLVNCSIISAHVFRKITHTIYHLLNNKKSENRDCPWFNNPNPICQWLGW